MTQPYMKSVFLSLAPRSATFSNPKAAVVALDLELWRFVSSGKSLQPLSHLLFGLVEDLEVPNKVCEVRVGTLALDQSHDLVQLGGRGEHLRRRRRGVNLQIRLTVL